MNAYLLIGLVWLVLFLFWLWLGKVFDLITEWHAAARREDAQATEGKGSC